MLFKRINRDSPEQVFVVVRANDANVTADAVVQLETNSASVDGVRVIRPATALAAHSAVVGIADAAIANGAYGLCQVYGYRSTSRIFQSNTSQALGDGLRGSSAAVHLSSVVSSATAIAVGAPPFAVLLETIASSTASTTVSRKIFIRAMTVLLALSPVLSAVL